MTSVVQSAYFTGNSVSLPSPPTAGNRLVLFGGVGAGTFDPIPTDGAYTLLAYPVGMFKVRACTKVSVGAADQTLNLDSPVPTGSTALLLVELTPCTVDAVVSQSAGSAYDNPMTMPTLSPVGVGVPGYVLAMFQTSYKDYFGATDTTIGSPLSEIRSGQTVGGNYIDMLVAGLADAALDASYAPTATPSIVPGGADAGNTWTGIAISLLATDTGPTAAFSGTPLSGADPLNVHFTNASTGLGTLHYLWDFGDGHTSTATNPDHTYTALGDYTVSLTVTDDYGTDVETKVAYVHVRAALVNEVYELIPPGDSIEFVGTLSTAKDKSFRPVRNQPGTGQFEINRYSAEATATILKPGNLVRCIVPAIDPNAVFAWFMEQGDFQLVASTEQGGENIKIGGRGVLSYWERAVWLSEKFTIPWWDAGWGTPPTGARGHVTFAAGTYRRYTIAGGVITGYTNFTTAGFEAYFDSRRTYDWPSENSKRFLVHIMAGETNAGWYVHPHQDGVVETLPSQTVGTSTSVLLSDISPDTPGAILYHLYQEGTDPGRPTQPIPLMTIDFTATTDSNGDPWDTTDALAGLTAELGDTYLDTIAQLVSTGVIDVEMGPDLDMHAYNSQGRDLSSSTFGTGKVRFVKGVNITDELHRERSDNPVATFIEVVGTDNVTGRASLPDAATRVAREISGTGDSSDEAVLEALGLAELQSRLVASDAIGFRVLVGNDEAAGLYYPGPEGTEHGKYWLGDVTTLHTGTGEQDFDQVDERVYAITIAEADGGILRVTPEVGSVLGEAERRLYGGLSTKGGTTSFVERSVTTDTQVAETAHPDLAVHDALGLATDAELAAHTGDTVDAHDASAISIADAGGYYTGTDVEAALQEAAVSFGAHDLDDLSDAAITSPVAGDRLRYDGSNFVNSALRWEPHVDYTGSVVLDGLGNPVMVEVS